MKKSTDNLILLTVIFITALITSNVISSNAMIITNIKIGNISLLAPAAVLAYSITFLTTDIIGQIFGKRDAKRAVIYGFIAQVICTGLIFLTPIIFGKWFVGSDVYTALNGLGWFTLASLVAYLCSQSWDVFIFHKIKDLVKRKLGEKKYYKQRWLWNNGSTITSQIIDTVLFIGIAFGIGQGMGGADLIGLMIGQYCIKFIIAILDTPFFYFFTRKTTSK